MRADDSAADDKPKQFLGLSGTQTIGSALAAVTSALVGSFLGVAGTLIGAALGSIVATVGAALYARTLSSAATMARTKIPRPQRNRMLAGDGDPADPVTAPASDKVQAETVSKRFTPKMWIKLGAVSAAAFVLAMVGLTAVEFGTNQPISSLVSSTSSIDDGATTHTTTLGKALTGTPANPGEGDKPADNGGQAPTPVDEGSTEKDEPATNSTPSDADTGSITTEQPTVNESSDNPPDLTPDIEQSQEPTPGTGTTSEPEVPADTGSAEQPGY